MSVTLESVVISGRTAAALREAAKRGLADLADFPLLLHIDDLLNERGVVNVPWSAFEVVE